MNLISGETKVMGLIASEEFVIPSPTALVALMQYKSVTDLISDG